MFMPCLCCVLKLSGKGRQKKKSHVQYDCADRKKIRHIDLEIPMLLDR